MKKFILSIDQGTTSSRAIIFNSQGMKVSSSQIPVSMITKKVVGQNKMLTRFGKLFMKQSRIVFIVVISIIMRLKVLV